MSARSIISAVKDRAVYAGVRSAITLATLAEPDTTLAGFARLGRLYAGAPFNRKRLDRAVANLSEAFPDWAEERKREYAIRGYEHLAMLGAELALMPRLMSSEGWADRARMTKIRSALDKLLTGGPCILVTGHVGNWELGGTMMAMLGFKIHAIYRPLDSPALDAWARESRSRKGLALLDKYSTAKGLPDIFARGECAAFVADQNAGTRGLFVPFFGRLASTSRSVATLAIRTGTPILPLFIRREPDGRHHITVRPPIMPNATTSDDAVTELTRRCTAAIETAVREAPDQWLWMHARWRTRPAEERRPP